MSFDLSFEPIARNIDIIDSFTLRHITVSLFVSTSCEIYSDFTKHTSNIMLFDSFNRAYVSSDTYCHYAPMTASYWKPVLDISSLSLRNKVNYKINMVGKDTITFTLCPPLCKKKHY